MKEVEIESKKLIKPANPTPPHLHTLKLSSIDQLLPPFFIPIIFYFDRICCTDGIIHHMMQTTHDTVRLLEESVSKVLTLYYPFAGRYIKDDSTISCHDQGVEFVVATVNCRLSDLVQGEYDHLVIATVKPSGLTSTTPLLSVQVNVFNCAGLAIGVGLMHKLGDMFTFSKFIHAWATACRLGTNSDQLPLPNFTLSSFLPPKSTKPPPSSSLATIHPPPNYIMKRYTFTGEAISNLKSLLNPSDYTRVELVTALITRSLINIECSEPGITASFRLCHHMNLRSRTILPIPDNSAGNFTMMVVAGRQVENEPSELQEVACFIRNSLRNAADEIGKVGDWAEIGRMAEEASLKFKQRKIMQGEKVNRVIFSSWCKFGLNEVDFGWGKPSFVSTVKGPIKLVDLMDCIGDARGIDAWVCLKEEDMTRFEQEPDILEYAMSF